MNIFVRIMIIPVYAVLLMGFLLDVRLKDIFTKKKFWTVIYLGVVVATNVLAFTFLGAEIFGKIVFLIMQLPVIIFFAIVSRYKGIKLVFVFLTVMVFISLPVMGVKSFFNNIFEIGVGSQVLIYFFISTAILVIIHRFFKPSFVYMLDHGSVKDFISFSLMPCSCFIYFFLAAGKSFSVPEEQAELVTQMPIYICILAYYLLLTVFKRTRDVQLLQNEKNMLSVLMDSSRKQIDELRVTQNQTLLYRHDMRHHLNLINTYISCGDTQKTAEYIENTKKMIDAVTPICFCENETINLILSSFSENAKSVGVTMLVEADLPSEIAIADTEICAVLSNSLENAITAASDTTLVSRGNGTVRVNCKLNGDKLLVFVENTCVGKVELEDGLPKSNRADHGFGTKSIASIAQKRNGYCACETTEGLFTLRVVLPLDR